MKYFYRLTQLLLLFSCNTEIQQNKNKVTVFDYQIRLSALDKKDLKDSTCLYFTTITENHNLKILYHDSQVYDSEIRYKCSIRNDSFFFYNQYCPPIDTLYFDANGSKIEVYKNLYDEEDIIDEELYVYWNEKDRLIGFYNYPWGVLTLFDYAKNTAFSKNEFYDFLLHTKKNQGK